MHASFVAPRLRRSLFLAVVAFLVAPSASAELRLKWDCYLPGVGVECSVLQSSLTSKIPFVVIVTDGTPPDVSARLSSVPAEGGARVRMDFVGKTVDGYTPEVHVTDKIPSSIDSATAMVRILTKVERGLDDFMDQRVVAEMVDGHLALELSDPSDLPFTGRPEQSSDKWYVAPTLSTYLSDVSGVGINASGSAFLPFNYSETNWRLQQGIGVNYSRQSAPVAGTNETASVAFLGGTVGNVGSVAITEDNRWNLGFLLSAEKNPQANFTFRGNASVGIELDLVPRQTENQANFGFHCAAGPEAQRYDALNVQGRDHQILGRQFCDVFLSWHFAAVDLSGWLGETSILEDSSYRSFNGGFSVTWRITDNVLFSPWFNVQQINQAINEAQPSNVVYADPKQEVEASLLAAVQQGYTAPFGLQTGLSLKYVLGNGSLNAEDQRWKGASNLR